VTIHQRAVWLWRQSIWHPDALPATEWKYRHIKRLWLPLYDLGIVALAVCGLVFGSPAIEELFPLALLHGVSIGVGAAGVACFVGVAFPRLWLLEVMAKSLVVGVLFIYAATLFRLTADGDPTRGFASIIALLAMGPPLIRMSILRGERIARDDKNRRRRKVRDQ
jgi:hypothetical protein